MDDAEIQKMLKDLALEFVCPLTLTPTTIYESGMVKNYIRFGHLVLKHSGRLNRMGEFEWVGEMGEWTQ